MEGKVYLGIIGIEMVVGVEYGIGQVVDVDGKQDWGKRGPLRYTTREGERLGRRMIRNYDKLSSPGQIGVEPLDYTIGEGKVAEFG